MSHPYSLEFSTQVMPLVPIPESTFASIEQPMNQLPQRNPDTTAVVALGSGVIGLTALLFVVERTIARYTDQPVPDKLSAQNTALLYASSTRKPELRKILLDEQEAELTYGQEQRKGFIGRHIGKHFSVKGGN
ncbi:MAG: hypothetical protein JWO47_773 [Candidatus Saccharibacteria bacterium]|nr:hypothetical protein [Candidatus Saccharibacteria bacterium]